MCQLPEDIVQSIFDYVPWYTSLVNRYNAANATRVRKQWEKLANDFKHVTVICLTSTFPRHTHLLKYRTRIMSEALKLCNIHCHAKIASELIERSLFLTKFYIDANSFVFSKQDFSVYLGLQDKLKNYLIQHHGSVWNKRTRHTTMRESCDIFRRIYYRNTDHEMDISYVTYREIIL